MQLPEALTELVSFIKNTQFNKATSQYAELKLAINTIKIEPVHLQISAKCTSAASWLMYEQLEMYETKLQNLATDKLVFKVLRSTLKRVLCIYLPADTCSTFLCLLLKWWIKGGKRDIFRTTNIEFQIIDYNKLKILRQN